MLVSDEFKFRLSFYKAFAVFCIRMMTLVATTGGNMATRIGPPPPPISASPPAAESGDLGFGIY